VALKQAQQHDAPALLANSRGEQWTYNGFSTVWHRFKTGLEAEGLIQPGLTLKGLRHTGLPPEKWSSLRYGF